MEYKKNFNKDKTKVTIILTGDNQFWNAENHVISPVKQFEVVKKEEIFSKMHKKEPINLQNKYIEFFSLNKYRRTYRLDINKEVILNNFNAQGSFFEGGVDFYKTKFTGNSSFEGVSFGEQDIIVATTPYTFWNAIFEVDKVSFERANFGEGKVSFENTLFKSPNISFYEANFGEGGTDFSRAQFIGQEINYNRAKFGEGEVSFWRAKFKGEKVNFRDIVFEKGNVSFGEGYFEDMIVDFRKAKFSKGDVDFIRANFSKSKVDFSYARFDDGEVYFYDTKIGNGKISFFGIRVEGNLDMRVQEAEVIDFSDAEIYGNIDFGSYQTRWGKHIPQVDELDFINTKLYGKIHMDYDEFGLKDAIENQDTTHKQKADQFRLFKENFRSLGQYDDEDRAYYWFKYYQIRAEAEIKKTDNGKGWLKKKLVYRFKQVFFELIGKYGTSPGRVALTMFITVLSFSGLYFLLPPNCHNHSPFFHSIITFLTIGYGTEYIELNFWGKLLSGFEGFLGLFFMAYFTISFSRKVLR